MVETKYDAYETTSGYIHTAIIHCYEFFISPFNRGELRIEIYTVLKYRVGGGDREMSRCI